MKQNYLESLEVDYFRPANHAVQSGVDPPEYHDQTTAALPLLPMLEYTAAFFDGILAVLLGFVLYVVLQ
jgi:hypothetical protein